MTAHHHPEGRATDSAGQPMAGRSLPAHPFAGDDGSADPVLRAALGAPGGPNDAAVLAALVGARLLVALVALPPEAVSGAADSGGHHAEAEHGTEVAAAILAGSDGRRAVAAFTCVSTVALWRADARSVPVPAAAAARSALDEADLMVLDPAGPVSYPVSGPRLRALAEGRRWLPVHADPEVRERVDSILGGGGAQSWQLQPPADPAQDDARLEIVLGPEALPEPLVRRLANDPLLRERLELGLELAVRHAPSRRP